MRTHVPGRSFQHITKLGHTVNKCPSLVVPRGFCPNSRGFCPNSTYISLIFLDASNWDKKKERVPVIFTWFLSQFARKNAFFHVVFVPIRIISHWENRFISIGTQLTLCPRFFSRGFCPNSRGFCPIFTWFLSHFHVVFVPIAAKKPMGDMGFLAARKEEKKKKSARARLSARECLKNKKKARRKKAAHEGEKTAFAAKGL